MRRLRGSAAAFTARDLLIVVVVLTIAAVVVIPLLEPRARPTGSGGMRDSTYVRGILQGLVIWAGNNQDRYPLPSLVDVNNATVAEAGAAKDTSANIFSMLIYQGVVPVDLCVSPAEVNSNIAVMEGYEFSNPKRAMNPSQALWDPAFSTDFSAGKSHLSYAHRPPAGPRMKEWANTFNPNVPVVGNRGPEIASATKEKAPKVAYRLANPKSNTLLILGGKDTWEGNIGYNDNHVNFESRHAAIEDGNGRAITYTDAADVSWNDCLFYDEPDDPAGANAYLGIFIKAGSAIQDFSAIWD